MRTRIVYVLVFDDTNYYIEQALVSECSARMHNPSADILVVTDKDSERLITGWRKEIYRYVSSVVGVDVPHELNKMQRSRWLKTNLRNLIDGDYLFIDTDTVICRPLDDIDRVEEDICAVADWHCMLSQARTKDYTLGKFAKMGEECNLQSVYFNSGVFYVRDTDATRTFYREWHKIWKDGCTKGVWIDQVSLAVTDKQLGHIIRELSGEWNCQIEGKFVNYLHGAYILHYYAFSNDWDQTVFYFKNRMVYENIRAVEGIALPLLKMLKNPYKAFLPNYEMLSGKALRMYQEYQPMFRLYGSPRRYRLLKWFVRLLSI